MIVYAESSAVIAWLFLEGRHDDARRILDDADRIVTSSLTGLEFARAVTRARVVGRVSAHDDFALRDRLDTVLEDWDVLDVSDRVLTAARADFAFEPVRALDAIHLATAWLFRQELGEISMLSFDKRIRANAPALGLTLLL